MTTRKEDADFIGTVINDGLLEESIEWIKTNLNPEEVFSEGDLETWAESNGWIPDE